MPGFDCVHGMVWRGFDAELRHWPVDMVVNGSAYGRIALHFAAPPVHVGARWSFIERTEVIEERGGPVEFVRQKLDARAATPESRAAEAQSRQLALF